MLRGVGSVYDHFSFGPVLGKGRYGIVRLGECNVSAVVRCDVGKSQEIRDQSDQQKESGPDDSEA